MSKTIDLGAIESTIVAAVQAGLQRAAVDVLLETACSDARAAEVFGPLVLAGHERRVLAALRDGDASAADVAGLDAAHFYGRLRGLCFAVLVDPPGGPGTVLGYEGLRRVLLRAHPHAQPQVDNLMCEIEAEPIFLGQPLKACVAELIAAAAWRDFADGVRRLNALTRAEAMGFDDRRAAGALDAPRLRAALRGLAEALTPALRACEEAGL